MTYLPNISAEYDLESNDLDDALTDAIPEVYEQFNIECPLHVWENGFEQGDASDAEIAALGARIGADWKDQLNAALETIYRAKLQKIEDANAALEDQERLIDEAHTVTTKWNYMNTVMCDRCGVYLFEYEREQVGKHEMVYFAHSNEQETQCASYKQIFDSEFEKFGVKIRRENG